MFTPLFLMTIIVKPIIYQLFSKIDLDLNTTDMKYFFDLHNFSFVFHKTENCRLNT